MRATAIKDHSLGRFKQGEEFTIEGVKYLKCGCVLFDVGIRYPNYNVHTTCKHGVRTSSVEVGWYASYMFTPTSEVKEVVSSLIELTRKETNGLLQGNSTNKERGY